MAWFKKIKGFVELVTGKPAAQVIAQEAVEEVGKLISKRKRKRDAAKIAAEERKRRL